MKDLFLTNYSETTFLNRVKESLSKCKSFCFSVSFIKKAGLVLIEKEIEDALKRGVKGKIITSTYQNFTDIPSLEYFLKLQKEYPNFNCHVDVECFGDNGYHSKGYLFEFEDSIELIVGSSNITRFALLKNIEWNVSLVAKDNLNSYNEAIKEFNNLWDHTRVLNKEVIEFYKTILEFAITTWDMDIYNPEISTINPNSMQRKALKELARYRQQGVKKALIISATGSGKTYLAAFDARNFNAKRVLFVVHRETILNDARNTFNKVFNGTKTCGIYSGSKKELECDFVFASSLMLSKHIEEFDPNEFDYICYDEVHHIVAETGKKIFNHFNPEFLLGLTATPERMDNKDVFELFDQNVPFELRLRDAINNDLVVPFHYYGIRDELLNYGEKDNRKIAFNIVESKNVDFIVSEINKHKPVNEKLKCIAFCTTIEHCNLMANEFRLKGFNSIGLTGSNNTGERISAFNSLQDEKNPLEIICTVDILNEGVDIPAINMVLFLRPTESSTIFLQQLGRGLRKYPDKEYLTVLDFIGNDYKRSVQIALALGTLGKTTYVEKKYLKDLVRNDFVSVGIPGVEIHIDELSKKEILDYIDRINFNLKDYLKKDYENFKKYLNLNTYPSHMDYLESEIAPNLDRFIKAKTGRKKSRSYYDFLKNINESSLEIFSDREIEFINSIEEMVPIVRVDEFLIIKSLLENDILDINSLYQYNSRVNSNTLKNAYGILKEKNIINNNKFTIDTSNISKYLIDLINYALSRYEVEFGDFKGKYKLYANYSKEQTITSINRKFTMDIKLKGTYFDTNTKEAFIYVGLKKDSTKQERTDYKDKFINDRVFQWESENNTIFGSSVYNKILNTKIVHLFVRKMDEEDGILLPFTYFGTGKFNKIVESKVINQLTKEEYPTLLMYIELDNIVPSIYFDDFEIDNNLIS